MISGLPGNYRFILASRSPRRQQLLKEAGLSFMVNVVDYNESVPDSLTGKETAEYLSFAKAAHFRNTAIDPLEVIITADTIVWCDGKILDKPGSYAEAVEILTLISGNTHEVITGVTLLSAGRTHTFSETTEVTFGTLSDEEINFYITNFRPFDKAGAYGIQEWIGIVGNSYIKGSYFNVMGLPVQRLIKELRDFLKS